MSDDQNNTEDPQEDKPLLDYWGSERSDLKLLERALKEGWPITPEIRRMAVARTALVAARSDQERNAVAAAKVLVMMDQASISRERMALDRTPAGSQHVHYEYHKHALTEEEYHARAARLKGIAGENGTADGPGGGNGQST